MLARIDLMVALQPLKSHNVINVVVMEIIMVLSVIVNVMRVVHTTTMATKPAVEPAMARVAGIGARMPHPLPIMHL